MHKQKQTGFTIVELLIVIVVIGILAAITIVAFNGIQARANKTAVQSDLANLAKQIQVHAATHGSLPQFGSQPGSDGSPAPGTTTFPSITAKISSGSYSTSGYNLYACRSSDLSSNEFGLFAKTKNDEIVAYSTSKGIHAGSTTWTSSASICPGLGFPGTPGYYYSYGATNGAWNTAWVQP